MSNNTKGLIILLCLMISSAAIGLMVGYKKGRLDYAEKDYKFFMKHTKELDSINDVRTKLINEEYDRLRKVVEIDHLRK